MKQDLNPLRTGLMWINAAVFGFTVFIGIAVNHYYRSGIEADTLFFAAVGTALCVLLLVGSRKKIVQGKSQISTLGVGKYFAVALNIAAFVMLGLALRFSSYTFLGHDVFLFFFGIFFILEILLMAYYAGISPLKDNQNQIFNAQV